MLSVYGYVMILDTFPIALHSSDQKAFPQNTSLLPASISSTALQAVRFANPLTSNFMEMFRYNSVIILMH